MEKERISRMLALALNTERLRERQLNASALISEVNIEYGRTMSAIIFEQRANAYHDSAEATKLTTDPTPSGDNIFAGLTLPEAPPRPAAPASGLIEVPAHDCLDQERGFAFRTFLSKPEIIFCTHKVGGECQKVLGLSLFQTSITKSMTDEEFRATQESTLQATVHYLKDTWSSALKSAVKTSLKDVGKGWFNLNET